MDLVISYLLFATLAVPSVVCAQEGVCKACNCQFDNLEVLDELIESRIESRLTTQINEQVSGVTYTRWGKASCPSSTGAQLVYSGKVGGTRPLSQGGSAERICIPDNPDYITETAGVSLQFYSVVQGAEYEFYSGPLANLTQHNAPCSVCYVPTRATTIMVPAKTMCPSSWTREYYGYLTTELDIHHRSSYTCLDFNPEVIAESSVSRDSSLLYHTVTDCNGLSCPPFENGRILSCAVCTK